MPGPPSAPFVYRRGRAGPAPTNIAAHGASRADMAAIELQRLTKRFEGRAAVDAIDLAVADGSLACLLGPSGCGKTTTLRLVAGFVEPDDGRILVGGKLLSSPERTLPPEQRNMSMIFQ